MNNSSQISSTFINPDLPLVEITRQYINAMLAREQKQARDLVIDAVERGECIQDIYLHVFQPVMYEIGRLWQTGEISVGLEHYCTNATQVIMSMLYPLEAYEEVQPYIESMVNRQNIIVKDINASMSR